MIYILIIIGILFWLENSYQHHLNNLPNKYQKRKKLSK